MSDALARSYLADTAWLVPSFLVPRTATWVGPVVVLMVASLVVLAARRRPSVARRLASAGVAVWLVAAAGLVAAIELDEDPGVAVAALAGWSSDRSARSSPGPPKRLRLD